MKEVNGVINVYKEKGFTSHDVVAKLRGILKTKKIGHTGTLDPDAEGVLPICIGNATKLCDLIMDKTKTYEAELVLGKRTDTQDLSGEVLAEYGKSIDLSEDEIKKAIKSFIGEYDQIPPMYSAIKVNGKKLYELARQGIEVERKARRVVIYDIEILDIQLPIIKIRVDCSKGTYIRALCNDIGDKLEVYGCMGYLLRTKSGKFDISESKKLSEIEKIRDEGKLDDIIIPTDEILDYKRLVVKEDFEKLLLNGNPLLSNMFENEGDIDDGLEKYRVYGKKGFVGVYKKLQGERILKSEKMFIS